MCVGGVGYLAYTLRGISTSQAEQADMLRAVLNRISDMTTFHTTAHTQSGRAVDVSVTCAEGESLADCLRRFTAAVQAVEELP